MPELNQWQKELERLMAAEYKAADSAIYNAYRDGLREIKAKLAGYVAEYDSLSFSKRLEVERLFGVAAEMDGILRGVFDGTKDAIANYGTSAANIGYNGTWYALEGAENIQMSLPQLDQAFVEAAINQPVAGKTLSQRLYQDRKKLAKETQSAIINGLMQGQGYAQIAGQVSNLTEASYKQALRIARTEAGRVRSQAALRGYEAARAEGVDLRLAWMSTLDSKTRKDHQRLDGQVADEEGLFWTGGMTGAGYSGKAPRLFGVAKEDINCRCTTVAVVDGVAPGLRLNNETRDFERFETWEQGKAKAEETVAPQVAPKETYKPMSMKEWEKLSKQHGDDLDYFDAMPLRDRVTGYVGTPNSYTINTALRNDKQKGLTSGSKKTMAILDETIASHKLAKNTKFDRYVNGDWFKHALGFDPAKVSLTDMLQKGLGYVERGYTSVSATSKANVFTNLAVHMEVRMPRGAGFYVPDNPKESELIFPRNMRYTVVDIRHNESGNGSPWEVILEAVLND